MSLLVFKTENSISKSWSTVCEGLTSRYVGELSEWGSLNALGGITDYEQKINSFVKLHNKLGLYKSPEKSLAIAVASPTPNQTLGVKHLDIDLIKSQLDLGVKVVYFAYNFQEEATSQTSVVEKTSYFGRNTLTGNLSNLETNDEILENVSLAIWMAFYKIQNTDIYYCIINDNLVDSTIIKEDLSDIVSFKNEPDRYYVLNAFDGNFKTAFFNPTVDNRAKFVGKNIIVTDKIRFELDIFGLSKFHNLAGKQISDEELPAPNLVVNSSLTTTINKNRILVDLDKKTTGTLSYQWVTGTELDYSEHEALKYEFVIVKI